MNIRPLVGILISSIAGFLGGQFASDRPIRAASPQVIQASRFELVDQSGVPVARWETGPSQSVHLRFLSGREKVGLDIGLLESGRPILTMNGRDEKIRLVMNLDQGDKPMLIMGDERWEGRMHLGFIPADSGPSPDWDHWGLGFRAFSDRPAVAMWVDVKGKLAKGYLSVSGRRIQ